MGSCWPWKQQIRSAGGWSWPLHQNLAVVSSRCSNADFLDPLMWATAPGSCTTTADRSLLQVFPQTPQTNSTFYRIVGTEGVLTNHISTHSYSRRSERQPSSATITKAELVFFSTFRTSSLVHRCWQWWKCWRLQGCNPSFATLCCKRRSSSIGCKWQITFWEGYWRTAKIDGSPHKGCVYCTLSVTYLNAFKKDTINYWWSLNVISVAEHSCTVKRWWMVGFYRLHSLATLQYTSTLNMGTLIIDSHCISICCRLYILSHC